MKLYPQRIQCGPDPSTGQPRLDLEIAGGHVLSIVLDVAHAKALSARLDAVLTGRVMALPPSRRVLEIALFNEDEVAATESAMVVAAGGVER